MAARLLLLASAAALACWPAAAAATCEAELAAQSARAGIPAPLAEALAASLAIGPGGRMHPYAVQAGGRSLTEGSARAAARTAADFLSRGLPDVRVGCLGASLMPGMDEQGILSALDPAANVSSALAGIGGSGAGIGDALDAISAGAPPPARAEAAYAPAPEPVAPARAAPSIPARMGSIGGGWSLFTDNAARPLANP